MRPSDDERAAFVPVHPRSPPPFSLDDDPDPSDASDDAFLEKADLLVRRTARGRWCGLRRLLAGLCSRRRSRRRRVALALKCTGLLLLGLLVLTPFVAPSYQHRPAPYRDLAAHCEAAGDDAVSAPGCANPLNERVFISVSLYDQAGHLAGGRWGQTILDLVHLLGPDNVFLSIYENNSGARGAAALEQLRRRLPCPSAIFYEDGVSLDHFPNVTLADGSTRTKRLAYLSEMRNRALRPLDTLGGVNGTVFDKVLFLNDIAFHPIDAAQLLFSTNVDPASGRAQYLSACALDWKFPFLFYDVYAQRDAEGFSNGIPLFPVFTGAGAALSRGDMLAQSDAVRVQSCWGGMVAMQALYVQNRQPALPRPDFQAVGAHVIDPTRPTPVTAPVRFRYEPEPYYDACECCLFLADVSQAARVAGAPPAEAGVFINPFVRVAYSWRVLRWVPVVQHWERLITIPQVLITRFLTNLPSHNPYRLVKEGEPFVEEIWNPATRAWTLETRTGRSGLFCGVRGMQVVREGQRKADKNWANTQVPPGQSLYFPHF